MSSPVLAIPTIDFAPFLNGSDNDRRAVAKAIGEACEVYGFLSLVGHGLPTSALDGAFQAAQEFFDKPDAEKKQIHDKQNNRGYMSTAV